MRRIFYARYSCSIRCYRVPGTLSPFNWTPSYSKLIASITYLTCLTTVFVAVQVCRVSRLADNQQILLKPLQSLYLIQPRLQRMSASAKQLSRLYEVDAEKQISTLGCWYVQLARGPLIYLFVRTSYKVMPVQVDYDRSTSAYDDTIIL